MMVTIETDPGWPTTVPLTVRHSQVVTSHDTEHSLHESVTCHKTVQTSNSHRRGYVVRWQNHRCGTWNASRELAGSSSASQERSVGPAGNRVVALEAYSDADWGGDRATRRSVSAGVIMRRKPLSQSVDQEAAAGGAVVCRE